MPAPTTRLLLVRHGQADPRGRFLQHRCGGLTEAGQQQALALGRRMREGAEWEVSAVLVSRAARSIQTGEAIAEALGLSVLEPSCELCEMHPGEAEGMTQDEMMARWGPSYADVPGGESYDSWVPTLEQRLGKIADDHRGQTVVCVTHNAVVKGAFEVFGLMPRTQATATATVANTAITEWAWGATVRWASDSGARPWTLVRHNDSAHLLNNSLR